ncbi:DUF695 domain-containing protein [Chitinibacteraceae bacterium HSL-7]
MLCFKHFLIGLALTLCTPMAHSASVTTWATAVYRSEEPEHAIVFRYAQSFRPDFKRADFPVRIMLLWPYDSASSMPTRAEREAMDHFEDLLYAHVDAMSILALVSTGEQLREWVFYAKSEAPLLAALKKVQATNPNLAVEVKVSRDPDWALYQRFRDTVGD